MSKFRSKCGHVMVMQTDDNPYEYRLVKDSILFDKYSEFEEQLPRVVHRKSHEDDDFDELFSLLLDISYPVLRCPQCGRIYIDINNDNKYVIFKPEKWED